MLYVSFFVIAGSPFISFVLWFFPNNSISGSRLGHNCISTEAINFLLCFYIQSGSLGSSVAVILLKSPTAVKEALANHFDSLKKPNVCYLLVA